MLLLLTSLIICITSEFVSIMLAANSSILDISLLYCALKSFKGIIETFEIVY